jgi:hypothetical protein
MSASTISKNVTNSHVKNYDAGGGDDEIKRQPTKQLRYRQVRDKDSSLSKLNLEFVEQLTSLRSKQTKEEASR